MHMWSCCFPFQTSCFFWLSRSRRCLLNFWVLISQDPHRELRGKNVLIARGSLQDTARLVDVDEAVLKEQLARAREILFEERKNRPPPHLDTKMITAWNGERAFGFFVCLFLLWDLTFSFPDEWSYGEMICHTNFCICGRNSMML